MELPANVRVSLLICNGINLPLVFEADIKETTYPEGPEYSLEAINEWEFFDEYDSSWPGEFFRYGYPEELISENIKDIEFFDGMNDKFEDDKDVRYCIIKISENGDMIDRDPFAPYGLWNTFNSKLNINVRNPDEWDYEPTTYNFDDWIIDENNYCDYMDVTRQLMDKLMPHFNMLRLEDGEMMKEEVFCSDAYDTHIWARTYTGEKALDVFADSIIAEIYRTKYDPLVYGYCRHIENDRLGQNIPKMIKDSVLSFYPFFLDY